MVRLLFNHNLTVYQTSLHPQRGEDTSLQRVWPNLAENYLILVHVMRITNHGVEHYAFLPSPSSIVGEKTYFSSRLVENYAFLPTPMSILFGGATCMSGPLWRDLGDGGEEG